MDEWKKNVGEREETAFLRADLHVLRAGAELPVFFSDDQRAVISMAIAKRRTAPVAVVLRMDETGIDPMFSLVFPATEGLGVAQGGENGLVNLERVLESCEQLSRELNDTISTLRGELKEITRGR